MSALDLIVALSTARRAVQLYPPTHPSHAEAIGAVVSAVRETTSAGGGFVLNLHEGRLYDGSQVITAESPSISALARSMEGHRVESLTFDASFSDGDAVALAECLNLRASSSTSLADELAGRGVTSVVVGVLADEDETAREERDQQRERDRALYRQLLGQLKRMNEQASGGTSPNLDQASQMVSSIMTRLVEDESAVLGMAMMNAQDEAQLFHSINVMIYSLTLGIALGLPDEGLLALGMAALLHDIGKAAFDLKDPEQQSQAQMLHPKVGAEILSRVQSDDPTSMLVAYEHHMGANNTGYPERAEDYFTHPYSRMVNIADWYENLTKHPDEGEPFTPDLAVLCLLSETRENLDPMLTRLFVRALGVFPIGCVVRLSDQSVGVVSAKTDDLLAPQVRLLFDDKGLELEDPADVDLRADGRSIVEVLEPEALELQVADRL